MTGQAPTSTAAVSQQDGLLKPMLTSSNATSFNLDSTYAKTKPSSSIAASSGSCWTHSIACSKGRWGGTVAACGVLLLVFLLLSSESSSPSNSGSGSNNHAAALRMRGSTNNNHNNHINYDNYDWKELPPAAKQAAKQLQWTPKSWNQNSDYPPIYYQPWSQLSGVEQDAATLLGYTIGAWETVLNPTGAGDNTDVANDDEDDEEEDYEYEEEEDDEEDYEFNGDANAEEKEEDDEHEVGQNQIQVSHATARNRYPDEYRAARDYLRAHHSSSRESGYRLLSFGSSTGEEAITLATLYFPNDDANIGSKTVLFGVDIDQETVSTAEALWLAATTTDDGKVIPKSKVTFFNGQNTSISEHGPYDAIFANSVLCSHPPDKGAKGVLQRFSFEQFESSLEYLDGNLKVGGLLAIVNTNYHFYQSKFSKRYTPLETKCKNFVPKVDVESAIFEPNGELFLADCVWVKNVLG